MKEEETKMKPDYSEVIILDIIPVLIL